MSPLFSAVNHTMSNLNDSPSLLSEALRIMDKWRIEHSAQLQLLDLPDMHLQERSPLDVMLAHGHDGMQTVTDQLTGNSW